MVRGSEEKLISKEGDGRNASTGVSIKFGLTGGGIAVGWPLNIAHGAQNPTTFRIKPPNGKSYNLTSSVSRQRLASDLERLVCEEKSYLAKRKTQQKRTREETPL